MWQFWKRRPRTIVLGQQLADAHAEEQKRLAMHPDPSPMPAARYDPAEGYLGMLNPTPIELDNALTEFCCSTAALESSARERVRRSISMDEFYTLLMFSRRTALFAMRNQSVEPLPDALNALALIELARVDYRDVEVALALVCHAAFRLGHDTRQLLRDAGVLAEPAVAQLMQDFAGRSCDEQRFCEMCGLKVVESKYGLGLVQSAFSAYSPTVDLVPMLIAIAELLDADQYRVGVIQVATDLPPVWLRAAGESAVKKALHGARAGASVSGMLRPEFHPTHASQSILAFLVELRRADQAQALLDMSRISHPGHSLLGCAQGSLFCLVIARSWFAGVASYETTASLARLGPGIADILR